MPINIIDVDEFTDPITAPAGADPANAASVVDPIQKLANRTRYLKNEHDRVAGYVGGANGSGEWVYDSPRLRSVLLPLATGNAGESGWLFSTISGLWTSAADNKRLMFPLPLPHGAELVDLFAFVTPGTARATPSDRVRIGFTRNVLSNTLPPAPGAADIQLGGTDDGTTNPQVIVFTPASPIVVDKHGAESTYNGWVDSGDTGSGDSLWGFGMTFLDPGPRNF